ncbi:MAG TPA: hypothetical protein VFJ43_07615 [Bacteroidia bacterium]|nr:hypothetical protein [Bacteroidia bacterium]
MKRFYFQFFFVLLAGFPLRTFAQKHSYLPPAVEIFEGTVEDSATKKPANKVWIKVAWGDSSQIVACDSHGDLDVGALFYHTCPDSIKITCATTAWRVTKYKVKTFESTRVLDATGKPTEERWYLVTISVWVTKAEDD